MKFTTDLERYFFACACFERAENMMHYCDGQRKSAKSKKIREEYEDRYFEYIKRSNFWWIVRKHFQHSLNDFGKFTRIKMSILVG